MEICQSICSWDERKHRFLIGPYREPKVSMSASTPPMVCEAGQGDVANTPIAARTRNINLKNFINLKVIPSDLRPFAIAARR